MHTPSDFAISRSPVRPRANAYALARSHTPLPYEFRAELMKESQKTQGFCEFPLRIRSRRELRCIDFAIREINRL